MIETNNNAFTMCEVELKEWEPGWGVRYERDSILLGVDTAQLQAVQRKIKAEDSKEFSHEFGPITVVRFDDEKIGLEIHANGCLRVYNKDRINWIRQNIKPF